jgi:hypothetical protein
VRIFAERLEPFEWKLHAHDRPPDLGDRLRAAGLVPENVETVMIAPVAAVSGEASLPEEVIVREAWTRDDLERIPQLEAAIWGQDQGQGSLADGLERERAADPDGLTIVVAEAAETLVGAGWVRFPRGTEFAT